MTGQELRDAIAALVARYDAELVPVPPPDNVIPVTSNLQAAIDAAPDGAVLDLGGATFLGPYAVDRDNITLRNGVIIPPPNCNDLLTVRGVNTTFRALDIVGDGTTKRGVSAQGRDMLFEDCRILNIRRAGQETQAVGMWDGTGLTMRRCVLEGGSQSFLCGGAGTAVPNHVPSDLLFEDCTFTRPLAWRGQGYACKTAFELKNARNVTVRNSILENVWAEGQTGIAITLTPSNYAGDSPETTVENVLFDGCTIRNVGGGVSALGYSQHQDVRPTLRGNSYFFHNNDWTLSKAQYGGQGALITLGWSPLAVEFNGNSIAADGDAFIRVSDSRTVNGFAFGGNSVRFPGTYGYFTPLGSRGGTSWATLFPDGVIQDNTFTNAHSTFRSYFPNNTYLTEVV